MPSDSRHQCKVKGVSGFIGSQDSLAVLVTQTSCWTEKKSVNPNPAGIFTLTDLPETTW
jgi:hypothetical protein